MNISEFLNISSAVVPNRLAVIFEGRRISYDEMLGRVNRLVNVLAGLGVDRGDRVAILQVNCNEQIEVCFACAVLEAVYVPLNFRARSDELIHMINESSPKILLVGPRYIDMVSSFADKTTSVKSRISLEKPNKGWHYYDELMASASTQERSPVGQSDDVAMILFTAGTTGSAKGVMLSHESFSSYIFSNVDPADPEIEERNILTVPIHHVAGVQTAMSAVYGGRTLIIQRQFEPKEWMGLVEIEQVTRAMVVPTMLKVLMEHPDFHQHDLNSLEVITYGAAPMPIKLIKRAIHEFPRAKFINAFGQTETASTVTMLTTEDHNLIGSSEEIDQKLRRLSSIGKPLEDVEVRIVDEEGDAVIQGEVGEIVARGERLMKGYWNMPEVTGEIVRDGWLYTGDRGYSDEDGYIFLSGRSKDFIKRGGEMISPMEVEEVLCLHEGVDEAAVIGVPDVEWGERVCAVVVLRIGQTADEQDLIKHCRLRLASFKKPDSIVFVNKLPRNPLGKVLKRVLRERYGLPIAGDK